VRVGAMSQMTEEISDRLISGNALIQRLSKNAIFVFSRFAR